MTRPRHLSLFSGSGIADYAAECAGFETVAVCECEPDCLYALRKIYPNAKVFDDVKSVGSVSDLGRIDLISGGFPCQDISAAGKGAGLAGERSGLWFEMLRVIREIRPAWVLAENVPALRTRGADRVIADLEATGYTVWPCVVGAWAAGAPHKRDRVWIVANADAAERRAHFEGQGAQGRIAIGRDDTAGAMAHSPLRQDHGRDGRGLEQEAAGGQGCNAAAGIGGEDELADARSQGLEGCRNGTIGPSKAQPLSSGIRFDRWPARPGEEQFEWEEPRVIETFPRLGIPTHGLARPLLPAVRRAALRILGNGWAPQVPWLILCWIKNQIEKGENQ